MPVATQSPQPCANRRKNNSAELILLFFIVGLLETILMYFTFSRADDHHYFLGVANFGLQAVPDAGQELLDFKAKTAAQVFYALTTPSRWLGGHELVHLLWLRFLTLLGFLSALSWFQNIVSPYSSAKAKRANLQTFAILVLIYPGQLAWTASLLRDGLSTAMFFFGLYFLRRNWRLILTPIFFGISFSLRPEYSIILTLIIFSIIAHEILTPRKYRTISLLAIILIFSIATHSMQVQSAYFAQIAYGEDGTAYPLVSHSFDVLGYIRVLAQSTIDPISLATPQALSIFGVAESIFFMYLLWKCCPPLRDSRKIVAAMAAALIMGLWVFAYFETYVSGFSRHRLCLEVALLALVVVATKTESSPTRLNKI